MTSLEPLDNEEARWSGVQIDDVCPCLPTAARRAPEPHVLDMAVRRHAMRDQVDGEEVRVSMAHLASGADRHAAPSGFSEIRYRSDHMSDKNETRTIVQGRLTGTIKGDQSFKQA